MLIDVDTVSKSWLDDPARPTAAVLAGALHGYAGDYHAARKGFLAARACPERRRQRYGMTILTALPKDQREQLIQELPMHEQNSWLEVERRSGTYQVGREAGRTEGRTEGRQEGREEGRAVLLELIFEQLAEHNVLVDAQSEARIRSCDDLQTLQRWVRRSFCATSVAELFEG